MGNYPGACPCAGDLPAEAASVRKAAGSVRSAIAPHVEEAVGSVKQAAGSVQEAFFDLATEASRGVCSTGNVYMVVCALDYNRTPQPLHCVLHAENMCSLARQCGVKVVERLFNEEATLLNVRRSVQRVGTRCGWGDYFIFYFAGRAGTVPAPDGKEGQLDEALVLVDQHGQTSAESHLGAQDLARLIDTSVSARAKVLLVSDLFWPEGIADPGRPCQLGSRGVTISGRTRRPTSSEGCQEVALTGSLLRAIGRLNRSGRRGCSLRALYSAAAEEEEGGLESLDLAMWPAPGVSCDELHWPLMPFGSYLAPYPEVSLSASLTPASSLRSAAPQSPTPSATSFSTVRAAVTHVATQPPLLLPLCKAQADSPNPNLAASPASSTTPHQVAVPGSSSRVFMVVCAMDHERSSQPLASTRDADDLVDLARRCNAEAVGKLYNRQASLRNVKDAVRNIGGNCGPGDCFVFCYAGRGPGLPAGNVRADGPGAGQAALCFMDDSGEDSGDALLHNEDFAQLVASALHPKARVLLLVQCSRPGAVLDLGSPLWASRSAILISACTSGRASPSSAGDGCHLTHSVLLAVERLRRRCVEEYSVGTLYNMTLMQDDGVPCSKPGASIQATQGVSPFLTAWPLLPRQAPPQQWRRCSPRAEPRPRAEPEAGRGPLPTLLAGRRRHREGSAKGRGGKPRLPSAGRKSKPGK